MELVPGLGDLRLRDAGEACNMHAEAGLDEGAVEFDGMARGSVVNGGSVGGGDWQVAEGLREERPRKNRTKARVRVGTLNMRGYGTAVGGGSSDRWMLINQLIRDEKIGVLALQETHLNSDRVEALNMLFGRNMRVFHSELRENATGACGVAFAVNKRFVNADKCVVREVKDGRALMITFPWSTGRTLSVLNVYGPNAVAQNAAFWKELEEGGLRSVDMMLGDFNVVEDAIDRILARLDRADAVEALRSLTRRMGLEDGWRKHNENLKEYTYLQRATGSQSCLDRIYVARDLHQDADEWRLKESGIPTDHKMAVVSLANRRAPFMGKGRWAMPAHLLTDPQMICTMRALGLKLVNALKNLRERTSQCNPQSVYADFKSALATAARERAKVKILRLQRRLGRLRDDLQSTLNPPVGGPRPVRDEAETQRHAAILQDRIDVLELKLFAGQRRAVASKHWVQSETMSRYWTRPNVAPLPSPVIPELRRTDRVEGGYTSNTKQMAEVARAHYDGLQDCDPMGEDEPHAEYIREALLPANGRLTNTQKAHMAQKTTRDEVEEAIKEAVRNKAPGLDGLPSEIWKTYLAWYDLDTKKGAVAVDVVGALATVFNDIASHGPVEGSTFTEGWICPIYKKKDTREIVNYRPITLLNSDYKIMTKTLATKLAVHAPLLIHPDQAGFVPGRRIFDHIQLSKMIMAYTEAEEINGAIVALDQEKAYDRIDHSYLWATLKHMNFPATFINT
ncbi:LINE-1 retrotransposable element ORF2 protein, partial [Trametes pubescens]